MSLHKFLFLCICIIMMSFYGFANYDLITNSILNEDYMISNVIKDLAGIYQTRNHISYNTYPLSYEVNYSKLQQNSLNGKLSLTLYDGGERSYLLQKSDLSIRRSFNNAIIIARERLQHNFGIVADYYYTQKRLEFFDEQKALMLNYRLNTQKIEAEIELLKAYLLLLETTYDYLEEDFIESFIPSILNIKLDEIISTRIEPCEKNPHIISCKLDTEEQLIDKKYDKNKSLNLVLSYTQQFLPSFHSEVKLTFNVNHNLNGIRFLSFGSTGEGAPTANLSLIKSSKSREFVKQYNSNEEKLKDKHFAEINYNIAVLRSISSDLLSNANLLKSFLFITPSNIEEWYNSKMNSFSLENRKFSLLSSLLINIGYFDTYIDNFIQKKLEGKP